MAGYLGVNPLLQCKEVRSTYEICLPSFNGLPAGGALGTSVQKKDLVSNLGLDCLNSWFGLDSLWSL